MGDLEVGFDGIGDSSVKSPIGASREQIENKLREAYLEKTEHLRMIDMLDGCIQSLEFVLNGAQTEPEEA